MNTTYRSLSMKEQVIQALGVEPSPPPSTEPLTISVHIVVRHRYKQVASVAIEVEENFGDSSAEVAALPGRLHGTIVQTSQQALGGLNQFLQQLHDWKPAPPEPPKQEKPKAQGAEAVQPDPGYVPPTDASLSGIVGPDEPSSSP